MGIHSAFDVKIEYADFRLNSGKLLVHGSFITEGHIVTKDARVSYYASKLGEKLQVWSNGTCHGKNFKLGSYSTLECGSNYIKTNYSSITIITYDWKITTFPNHVYGHVHGPTKLLDFDATQLRDVPSDGIVGQSFSRNTSFDGKLDIYPKEGEYTTVAMAEGAIVGDASDYEITIPLQNYHSL